MKALIFAISFASVAATAAFAQDQGPPPGGQSPFMQACGADVKNYCASAQNRDDRHSCIMANKDKFSDSCKAFMANHQMHQHGQGQMQGPGNGQQ
jgi:hypothetical protein